jgi:hypothetical protein
MFELTTRAGSQLIPVIFALTVIRYSEPQLNRAPLRAFLRPS